ncbi:MAG: hypothetical protein R2799_08945 [Crocinitomicaceae bacterium]
MPIDPMILNAMLDTFRGMAKDIEGKGLKGEDVDKMNQALNRMEELGQQLSDINEFNGALMQENLFGTFSDHYGKVLATEAQGAQDEKGYDDATLLRQTLDALKDSVKRIKQGKQDAIAMAEGYSNEASTQQAMDYLKRNSDQYSDVTSSIMFDSKMNEALTEAKELDKNEGQKRSELIRLEMDALFDEKGLIEPIEALIQLGEEPGMTLPLFLKIQIEKGMDKAMEGSAILRDGMVYQLEYAKALMVNPYDIEEKERILYAFDDLASKAKFGVPNSLEVTLADSRICWELEPKKIFWNELKSRFFNILDHLDSLIIANSQYFPSYAPYTMMATYNEKKEHAEYIKNCMPGIIKQEEKQLEKYFGATFLEMFNHEIFKWEVEGNHIDYSQFYTEFLKNKVYPEAVPLQFLSANTISEFESTIHDKNVMFNPESYKVEERIVKMMNDKFGEGYYEQKFGRADFPQRNAAPWDINNFN